MSATGNILRRGWARWLPWRLFLGPIFLKEVTVSGRRKGVYAIRCLYTLALAVVTGIAFFAATENYGWYMGAAARLEAMQQIAPVFAEVFGWMQMILLTIAGAVMTSAAFSEEKTNRTLHSLMTTPLLSAQIVFGKLSSRLLQIVILAMIPMPVLLGLRVYGGLEPGRVVAGTVLAIASAGFASSISLLLSIFNKRPWSVIILTCVTVFVVQVAPMVIVMSVGLRSGYSRMDVALMAAAVLVSPQLAFAAGMPDAGAVLPLGPMLQPSLFWIPTSVTMMMLTLLIGLVSSAVLRPVTLQEKSRELPEADEAAVGAAATEKLSTKPKGRKRAKRSAMSRAGVVLVLMLLGGGFAAVVGGAADEPIGYAIGIAMPIVGFLIDALAPRRQGRVSRDVSDRPVFWRELRSSFVGSRGGVIVLGVFVGGIMFFAYREAPISLPELHMGVLGGLLGVQLLAAATMTTGRIATERDARTWDTLLCTPLSARRIVWEKVSAAFVQLMPVPAVMLVHMVVYMFLGVLPISTVLCITSMTLGSTAMLCCTGLLLGMWRGKATGVAVMNLAFAAALWIGLPVGTLILSQIAGGVGDAALPSLMLFFNPMFLSMESINAVLNESSWDQSHHLGSFKMSELGYTFMTLMSALVLTGIGLAALSLSIGILKTRSLRAA